MAETLNLGLTLLESNQAQKHVTVNEALHRLDALVQGRAQSRSQTTPPADAAEGENWLVPSGATGIWAGQQGRIAHRIGAGWDFLVPKAGWRLFIVDESLTLCFDGQDWSAGTLSHTTQGAGLSAQSRSADVTLTGASVSVPNLVPDRAIVLGVTGRVIQPITGAATWRCGVAGATNRYGSGIGAALNSWLNGVSGTPTAYYGNTNLLITAESGSFTGGTVRLTSHFFLLQPERSV